MHCDLICFSHLRWNGSDWRPRQLMAHAARTRQVLFVEEPVWTDASVPSLTLRFTASDVRVLVPQLPDTMEPELAAAAHAEMIQAVAVDLDITPYQVWYTRPESSPLAAALTPIGEVHDCMQGLLTIPGASVDLRESGQLRRAG